eukprot:CAMPEP_0115309200 /NCGR_PEP_ID=MMETSP0270-20121206/74121_1 /TAXON_ID=71861 /ORGANISM="Scrippsiella trochoidea, Strain CCMP3099" /LENGTH=226 /DNA_ID=CAMNT_0002727841 /DNA_START=76 /DNA_END=756 /DNA_ORIENTATION=-
MTLPSEAAGIISDILRGKDLTKTSLKEVRSELESRLSLGPGALDSCKEEIKQITTAEIARIQQEEAAAADLEGGADAGDEEGTGVAVGSASVGATPAGSADASGAAVAAAAAKPAVAKKGRKRTAEQPAAALEGQEGGGGKGKSKGPGTKERQKQLMSRKKFLETAESFKVQISDRTVTVPTKVFSTNSCGWFANPKVSMKLGGQEILVQCQIQCTVIGSKEWAEE